MFVVSKRNTNGCCKYSQIHRNVENACYPEFIITLGFTNTITQLDIRISLSPYNLKIFHFVVNVSMGQIHLCTHLFSLLASIVMGLGDDRWPGMGIRLVLSPGKSGCTRDEE